MSKWDDKELQVSFNTKPKATKYNPVFRNTFTNSRNKWLRPSMIFLGLKRGKFQWEKLPPEIQNAVKRWLNSPEFH